MRKNKIKYSLLMLLSLGMISCGKTNVSASKASPSQASASSVSSKPSKDSVSTNTGSSSTSSGSVSSNTPSIPSTEEEAKEYSIKDYVFLGKKDIYVNSISFMYNGAKTKYFDGETVNSYIEYSSSVEDDVLEATYIYVNDLVVKPTKDSANNRRGDFSFVMPKEDVTIRVVQTDNVLSEDGGALVDTDISQNMTLLGYVPGEKYKEFHPLVEREEGYQILSLQYKHEEDENYTTLSKEGYNFSTDNLFKVSGIDCSKDFSMKLDQVYVGSYEITYKNIQNAQVLEKPKSATYGDIVEVNGISAKKGYFVASPASVVGTDDILTSKNNSLSFVMPRNDVTVLFNVNENGKITVADNASVASYTITDSEGSYIDDFKPGVTVKVTPRMNNDLAVLIKANVSNVGEVQAEDSAITFSMPKDGSSVNIEFVIKQGYQVASNVTNGSIVFKGNKTAYYPGETVYFRPAGTNSHYVLKEGSVKIDGHDDISITKETSYDDWGSEYETGYYQFTMPDYAPTILATYEEKANINVSFVESDVSAYLKSFTIEQKDGSSFTMDDHAAAKKFYIGESVNFSLKPSDSITSQGKMKMRSLEYNVIIHETDGDKTCSGYIQSEDYIVLSNSTYTISEKTVSFEIKVKEREALKVTIDDKTNGKAGIKYYYKTSTFDDATEVTSLNGLYAYTGQPLYLNYEFTGTPDDGKEFTFKITDTNGDPITKGSNGYYLVFGDFNITIDEETKKVKYTISYTDSTSGGLYVNGKKWSRLTDDEKNIEEGSAIKIEFFTYTNYHLEITGVSTPVSIDKNAFDTYTGTLTVTGNVSITATERA